MKRYVSFTILLIACVSFGLVGCRAGIKDKKGQAAAGPAAEVKQAIPTPTLAPAVKAPPPPPPEAPPPPKGPITVVPPPVQAQVPAGQPPLEQAQAPMPDTALQALPAPGFVPPEAAKAQEAPQVAFEPKLVRAETNIEVILDASGSMAAPFGLGATSKFDLMRANLLDIISEMGAQQTDFPRNVAIRVFGSKSPVADNNREDTERIVNMGAPDTDAVKAALGAVKAQGQSPIALSLIEAANDFPADNADHVIVLVADGGDNTEGDACAATEQIEMGAVKAVINVVAFDIKPEDQPALECIAQKGNGKFYLARNENELRQSLDESINATLPYNLKLSVTAGSTPMPFELAVYKAGQTMRAVKTDKGFGSRLLRLEPGTYDIFIEHGASPEKRKPSKMLKGVDILSTAKVEQTVNFELGGLKLSATDGLGAPTAAHFKFMKAGTNDTVAEMDTLAETVSYFLPPGVFDITAELAQSQLEAFVLEEKGVEIKLGETAERAFRFQKGTLSIKGITTLKESIPFIYQVYRSGNWDDLIASGALPADGGQVQLAPGKYDLLVLGTDPKMTASPRTKITGVEIKGADQTDLTATFEMGIIKLSAIDGQGGKLPAEFVVRDHDTQMDFSRVKSENGDPVQAAVPPGNYDIVASSLKSILDPKPSVPVTGVAVTADKPTEQVIKFVLGTLRLRGRSAKEQAIQSQFTIYKAATDEKVSSAPPAIDWMVFDLAPGNYDVLGTNTSSTEQPQPMIWLRDIKVEDGKATSHEAIYTAGKLKIIGRGTNNQLITCHFKVFQYGSDRELINGVTGNDWSIFEIQPGGYYLEASYHDDAQSVMLKKWINIKVGENEVVEEVLRF